MPNDSIEKKPVIYAIGGPNGAGKTTFAREFLPAEGIEHFLLSFIFLCPRLRCCTRPPTAHPEAWLVGWMHPSKFSDPKSMKESDGKPSPAQMIDADAFMKSADAAMRRAYLVAKKEAARYGLKLVVNRPYSPRKARTVRSRRVVEVV